MDEGAFLCVSDRLLPILLQKMQLLLHRLLQCREEPLHSQRRQCLQLFLQATLEGIPARFPTHPLDTQ